MTDPGQGLRVARIHGIDIRVDRSWAVILLLVAWSLAFGHFPMMYPGWELRSTSLIGVVGSLLLFADPHPVPED